MKNKKLSEKEMEEPERRITIRRFSIKERKVYVDRKMILSNSESRVFVYDNVFFTATEVLVKGSITTLVTLFRYNEKTKIFDDFEKHGFLGRGGFSNNAFFLVREQIFVFSLRKLIDGKKKVEFIDNSEFTKFEELRSSASGITKFEELRSSASGITKFEELRSSASGITKPFDLENTLIYADAEKEIFCMLFPEDVLSILTSDSVASITFKKKVTGFGIDPKGTLIVSITDGSDVMIIFFALFEESYVLQRKRLHQCSDIIKVLDDGSILMKEDLLKVRNLEEKDPNERYERIHQSTRICRSNALEVQGNFFIPNRDEKVVTFLRIESEFVYNDLI